LRVKGLIALSGERDEAAGSKLLSKSGALARKQGALAWELRAAMTWVNCGLPRAARAMRSASSSRFTAGSPKALKRPI